MSETLAPTFRTVKDIIREIRQPSSKVYIGMLIKDDVVYIAAEKSDLLTWLSCRRDMDDCGVYATREVDGLYITCT